MDGKELDGLRDFWDSMAERFKDFDIPTPYNNTFMKNLYLNGILEKGGSALDIGCGGGKYSFALSPYFDEIIGTDISEKMIFGAEERKKYEKVKNITFRCISWQESDIKDLGWEKEFDLVIAHMTPAVDSTDAIKKMRDVSKGWCVITKYVYRKSDISDEVNSICGIVSEDYGQKDMLKLFEMLWKEGMGPDVFYERQQWGMIETEKKAAETYIKRVSLRKKLTQKEKEDIFKYFKSISKGGIVMENTDALLCSVFWNENKEEIK